MRLKILILLTMVAASIPPLCRDSSIGKEEYRVIASVLDTFFTKPDYGPYVVSSDPIKDAFVNADVAGMFFNSQPPVDASYYPLLRELLADAASKRLQSAHFSSALHTSSKSIIDTAEHFCAIHNICGSWERVYKVFPKFGGYLQFSRVAFSKDQRHALVYMVFARGDQDGSAWVLMLEHQDKRWRIIRKTREGVS
jgi:hypothetical protein